MTRNGLTTIPPVRPPFRPGRRFAVHVFPRTCGRHVEMRAGPPPAGIDQNDCSLRISRYVDTSEEEERIDVAEAARNPRARELEQERAAAEVTMHRYLAELVFDA